jgi:hypothetical protein
LWRNDFGDATTGSAAQSAVPEPAAWLQLVLCGVALLCPGRRRRVHCATVLSDGAEN